MAFRFFRRLKLAPGVSMNLSKSGVSPSFGIPGARLTLGRQGVRRTVGIPGTGLFYTEVDGSGGQGGGRRRDPRDRRGQRDRHGQPSPHGRRPAPPPIPSGLDLGFFQKLFTPRSERDFVAGCKAHVTGDAATAAGHFAAAADRHADAAFLAGFLALDAARLDQAVGHLERAAGRHRTLGRLFTKYGLNVELALPIADLVVAHVRPTRRGALLGLAEAHQARGDADRAVACLQKLHRDDPDDVVIRVSLAESLLDPDGEGRSPADAGAPALDRRTADRVITLAGDVANASSLHAALLWYKGQALRALGLTTAARDALTAALRRRKDRDPELLREIRRERARVYAELGQRSRARKEWERIYAEDPGDDEAARILGLT
jgi:tetratricopeptide (TPR) repeat protein